jgi:hypothetical protein
MSDGNWCLSGKTLMMAVLDSMKDKGPIESNQLQRLLRCCRTLEWSSRDCFVVLKKARSLGLVDLAVSLETDLRDRFRWSDQLLVILSAKPVAPIEKLQVARNWFVKQQDGRMASHLRHMIALAKRHHVIVHCLCRTQQDDDGCEWIACDACNSWYHPACVGIYKAAEELETTPWTCPMDCWHMQPLPKDISPDDSSTQPPKRADVDVGAVTAATAVTSAAAATAAAVVPTAHRSSKRTRKLPVSYSVESEDDSD